MPDGSQEKGDLQILVDRFRAGDDEALGQLWQLIGWRINAFIAARCRPPLDIESLAQDVWLTAAQKRELFDGQNFQAWLFMIAKRKMIDAIRRNRTESLPEDHDPVWPVVEDVDDRPRMLLKECAGMLKEPFKSTIVLLLRGVLPEEAAAQMNVSRATIDGRKHRAIESLKECVARKTPR